MENVASNLWKKLLEMVFPAFCLGCKEEGSFLCDLCATKFGLQDHQICPFCAREKCLGLICDVCKKPDVFIDGLIAAVSFREVPLLQTCIYAF